MAGLKKPAAKKPNNANPNTVLVVFLVLFILVSIGLGVWGYYGYAGQEELRGKSIKDAAAAKAARETADYFTFMWMEMRLAVGDGLEPDDLISYATTRTEFENDAGKYKLEKTRDPFIKLMAEIKKDADLGYDAANKKYKTSYKERLTLLTAAVAASKAEADAQVRAAKAANVRYDGYVAKLDAAYQLAMATIKKGNADSFAESSKRSTEFNAAINKNDELRNEIRRVADEFREEKDKLDIKYNKLAEEYELAKKNKQDANAANPRVGGGAEAHALLMNISTGKPLWDYPVGKIARVELQDRHVIINLGSADGVKPELTFNVFKATAQGRADGGLKGTIEVIKVLDPSTSVARITSLYDADGYEILLNDRGKGRIQRESENAIKENDVLFNVFWGTHVAIAGEVNWTDFKTKSPAEQMRNLEQFMHLLTRQGVIIDAYINLNDGTVKGELTPRTRFLIVGNKPAEVAGGAAEPVKELDAKPEPKLPAPGEKEEMKPGEGAKEVGENRVARIDEAMKAMKAGAIERGMFHISAENYANVVGYRKPRSANVLELSTFRPTLPSAYNGSPLMFPGAPAENK